MAFSTAPVIKNRSSTTGIFTGCHAKGTRCILALKIATLVEIRHFYK